MRFNFLIGLCLSSLLACGSNGNIGIAPDKSQGDTFDPIENEDEEDPLPDEEEQEQDLEPITDFSQWGPHYPYGIAKESRTVAVTNCSNMEYEVFTPYVDNPPVVVLGHGFARGADTMTGWAEHLSSWGVEVLLPTLCHYNVFAGVDHEMNGRNMTELALSHGATEVVYAGHSAGGLAAVIAAGQDLNALGVLGLDATDTQDVPGVPDLIGQRYAGNAMSPGFSIIGEQSSCNADNNGIDLFKMLDGYHIVRVNSADHCDFESPTDWVCESQCENSTIEFSDEEIRPIITTLGTAAVMSLTGLSEDGSLIWSEGLESWKALGIIQEIE